jgi:hypothetical protein
MPQIIVNNTTNSLEIIAPEPLLTQLVEYAKEVDENALTEPGRKLQVIPLTIKAGVLMQAINEFDRRGFRQQPGIGGMQMNPYGGMQMNPYGGGMQMLPSGGFRRSPWQQF